MIWPSSAFSNWFVGTSTFLMMPSMSVNVRRRNRTPSFLQRSRICFLSMCPPRPVVLRMLRLTFAYVKATSCRMTANRCQFARLMISPGSATSRRPAARPHETRTCLVRLGPARRAGLLRPPAYGTDARPAGSCTSAWIASGVGGAGVPARGGISRGGDRRQTNASPRAGARSGEVEDLDQGAGVVVTLVAGGVDERHRTLGGERPQASRELVPIELAPGSAPRTRGSAAASGRTSAAACRTARAPSPTSRRGRLPWRGRAATACPPAPAPRRPGRGDRRPV